MPRAGPGGRAHLAGTTVEQTSESAVSRVSQTRRPHDSPCPADWEVGDTAGWETCATKGYLAPTDGI